MGKATGNISQRVIPVKLNKEQIHALDIIVEKGDFNGRSHAIRELCLPYLESALVAEETKSVFKATKAFITKGSEISARLKKVHKAQAKAGQDILPLDIQVQPT